MHTFVLIMTLIGSGESVSTASFATLEQCTNAGQNFLRTVPVTMGYRGNYICQQADENMTSTDVNDEMYVGPNSEMNS